jgi:hypothetical protein
MIPEPMNKKIYSLALTLAALLLVSSGLQAQDKAEVSVLVKKNGEVIKDTTYQFDDASDAENALKMMEIISEDEPLTGEYQYNYSMSATEGNQSKTMVFVSEDGDHTKITELDGDSLVWIEEGDEEGQADVKQKKIRVMVSDDEGGTWTVREGGEDDEGIYILKGDQDVKVELKKILEEEEDGDGTKVIVIRKQVEKDHDGDLDNDQDADADKDVDVNVEVKVKKKIEIEE